MRRSFVVYELPIAVGILLAAFGLPILIEIRHGRLSPAMGIVLLPGSITLVYLLLLGLVKLVEQRDRRRRQEREPGGETGTTPDGG